jgi:endonuclease YncB( thermonuclease family)
MEYNRVRDVLSPEQLVLGDGVRIRLRGVKERAETREKAMQFLEEKARGQKVMLRFDAARFDEDDNLLCHLYLLRKTFINAHMIKAGLVAIDIEADFRLKDKFMLLART